MKHMAQTITGNYSAFMGTVVAITSMIFGEHWYLFALFLTLSIADWVAGWTKSRIMKKENSVKGWQGILKKIGCWIMITFVFTAATGLIEVGKITDVDLQITALLGWFVLASLIVNGARSVCEDFAEAGFNVPKVLNNGLAVADELINKRSGDEE